MTQPHHRLTGTTDKAETFWENLYHEQRDNQAVWGTRVNPRLVEVATSIPAGTALDLACGAGGDTIWLARHGWRVTAVDIATTAVEQVLARAQDLGLGDRVTIEQHDLARSFPNATFDLVSAQYFHTPFAVPRAQILRAAAEALRPGGRLLVVDHGSIAPWSWNQDPGTRFPTPTEVHIELDLAPSTWTIERADTPRREAAGPDGQRATVTDHILLIRRTSH
ncbi:class I SAM-dependent methyltransferase [Parafrankia sp. FMc6]|uniref:SAM-dependent methyltransferase n=1 Tax=Parafrankia soli TaxID=2599596 RepID=UPI0034D64F61